MPPLFAAILRHLFLPLACLAGFHATAQVNRYALLVAVGNYPDSSGWLHLSATADVPLVKNTLLGQGFPEAGIATLLDSAATKAGILNAIHLHLAAKVHPGDVAVFHFSGHGQQVRDDDNQDEIDGLDEALVPFDASKFFKKGHNEGEKLLRDDELGAALLEVRRTIGPEGSLLVLIDACHSGTGTRGRTVARGTDIIMADSLYLLQIQNRPGDQNTLGTEAGTGEAGAAPMIAFFSSSPRQLSYEYRGDDGKHFGLFSYAFSKAMSCLPADATWRSLLDYIKLEVSAFTQRQTPQAEGLLDQLVLGKGIRPVAPYFSVIEAISPELLLVNAGELQGLTAHSRVALYPAGTSDTAGVAPLALGTVDEASTFDADILTDHPLAAGQAVGARVFLRERSYGSLTVRMQLTLTDAALRQQLETELATYPFLEVTDGQPDLYLENAPGLAGTPRLTLYQNDDATLWNGVISPGESAAKLAARLAQSAAQYARANYLRALETADGRLQAVVQILVEKDKGHFEPLGDDRPLHIGETVRLQISNTGKDGFYFTLLDIQPDHAIATIFPGERPAADYFLPPGGTFTAPFEHTVEKPTGAEVLKIIATTAPLDLGFARSGARGFKNPLEVLLSNLLQPDVNVRGETPGLPGRVGFVGSLVVEIVE